MLTYRRRMGPAAKPRRQVATERARGLYYRIATPAQGLLVAYGIVDKQKAALWVALGSGLVTGGLAAWHTSTARRH